MFSGSHNDQDRMIAGYNKLIDALPPQDRKRYQKMNARGVCSADVTIWASGKIIKYNEFVRKEYIQKRNDLIGLSKLSTEQLKRYINENRDDAIALANYGNEIQVSQNGNISARNVENKFFRNQMQSIWLFSLPLNSGADLINQSLKKLLKPGYIYRFFSEGHVIGAYIDDQKICIHDPNDEHGEVSFSKVKDVVKYLN